AEDGIRDFHVTGVQTCALPISTAVHPLGDNDVAGVHHHIGEDEQQLLAAVRDNDMVGGGGEVGGREAVERRHVFEQRLPQCGERSEERRVGKECRAGGAPEH